MKRHITTHKTVRSCPIIKSNVRRVTYTDGEVCDMSTKDFDTLHKEVLQDAQSKQDRRSGAK